VATTSRMDWPFPGENQDPWYQAFEDFATALDGSGFAAREDRHLVMVGGGTVTWDASSSLLGWSADIQIVSPISGFLLSISPASVSIVDGQVLYATLIRAPTQSQSVGVSVGNQVPQSDVALLLAVRVGDRIYWRNGMVMDTGDSVPGLAVRNVGDAAKDWQADFVALYLYTQAATPVEETIGQGMFDGSRVGGSTASFFGMFTPTFAAAGSASILLYDQGPSAGPPAAAQLVATLSSSTGGGPQYVSQVLTVGASPGVNQIANSSRMYEVRALMSALTGDTLFVGGGGLEVH